MASSTGVFRRSPSTCRFTLEFEIPGPLIRIKAPWRFCVLARGIPGLCFHPETSRIWGRLRVIRSVISSLGLARNYVPDGPQTTLKSETLRGKPHVWGLLPAPYPPLEHAVSPWKSPSLWLFESYRKRNFQLGDGSKFRFGWPSKTPRVETD